MQVDKYMATARQIIAMKNNELDWLKSPTVHVDSSGDVYIIQTSAMEMARVVNQFCEIDGEKMDSNTNKTLEPNSSAVPNNTTNADRQEGEPSDLQNSAGKDTGMTRYRTHWKGHGPPQQTHTVSWRKYRTSRKSTPGTDKWNFIVVLSGMHACVFCDIMVCDMTEHLLQCHKGERQVEGALTNLPSTFEALIRQGDHRHNVKVLHRQHGILLVLKLCINTKSPEDYMPCPDCLAYIFYAEFLSHRRDCEVLAEKGIGCNKRKADPDEAPQSKKVRRTLSAVEVSNIVKTNALRNLVILMLSDAVAMLPESSRRIISYEDSMIAAERRNKLTQASSEVEEIVRLVGNLKKSYSTSLTEALDPTKFHIVFKLMNWLYEHSRQEDTLQSGVSLKQRLVSELGHCLKACASQIKDKVEAREKQNALLCRVEKYLSLFDSMTGDIPVQVSTQQIVCDKSIRATPEQIVCDKSVGASALQSVRDISVEASPQKLACDESVQASPQQIAAPVQPELNLHKTPEFPEILLLTKDVLQLEKYLKLQMEEGLLKLTSKPTICQYISFLEITAAKLVLFNKPRAKEVVMLTVASYKDASDKLDPAHEILGCLSSTERKLCERLVVMQVPNKEGVMVPILVTPKVKTALDSLLKMRSLLSIHPVNPYLFAKNRNEYLNVCEVLYTATANAQLQTPQLVMSVYMDNFIATICQICAMNGSELVWLKSHVAHLTTCGKDVGDIMSPSFNMATVVELLCKKDWRKTPDPQIADASSSTGDEPIPQSMDTSDLRSTVSTVDTSNIAECADEPVEEKYADVLRRTSALEQVEEDDLVIRITVDEVDEQEEDKSVMKMSVDLPNLMGVAEELPEEKYSEVLRREIFTRTTTTSEFTEDQREEKYSDVLTQGNSSNTMEDGEELPEEKYSDVMRRENKHDTVEDGEKLPGGKYSDVMKRGV